MRHSKFSISESGPIGQLLKCLRLDLGNFKTLLSGVALNLNLISFFMNLEFNCAASESGSLNQTSNRIDSEFKFKSEAARTIRTLTDDWVALLHFNAGTAHPSFRGGSPSRTEPGPSPTAQPVALAGGPRAGT